jgi:murein DD-endopeptidase MepM/ murein hydrolase activator NlpD
MQQQIDEQQSDLAEERDRLSNRESAAKGQLGGILYNLRSTNIAQKDYEFQIDLANRRIKELQVDLADAERTYRQKQAATIARLRFLQRQPLTGWGWDVLLDSENLSEFLARRRRVKLVYRADRQILGDLKVQAEQIHQQKAEIERQKNNVALLKQQLLAKKAEYEAQLETQKQLVARLNTDKEALESAQAQLEADSEAIGILIQRQMAAGKARLRDPVVLGSGRLLYPSDGAITSAFGWRRHPLLGSSRFHAGIDFGASYGSTIRAADSGTVIFSGWYGGYGYAVVIDHGGGIATLYGHSSELYVSEGQTVQRGEAIAAVGSTGLSTGPHLHFEVRENGKPVDPTRYL